MNRQLALRLAMLEARLPPPPPDPHAGHTHPVAHCYILGDPAPPDGALDAYLATRPVPCRCDHPWALLLVWDGVSWREDWLGL